MDAIIGGSIAAFIIYASATWRDSERKKIEKTFDNLDYNVGDNKPRLIRTHKHANYTTYTYSVPYGLIDDNKLDVLAQVLNRPVRVSFTNTKLHVKVYRNDLPKRLTYDWNAEPTPGWSVPIGVSHDGMVTQDFDKIPHMTVAGMTRQGKTVLLKLIFAHLIRSNPEDVEFYIIDLKGGLEFGPYENMRQVKSVASDVYSAYRSLTDVLQAVKNDMATFRQNGYRNVLDTPIKTRKFIIIDEGAELDPPSYLPKEDKAIYHACQHALSEIARIAGALGYRLIFGTQYPTADTLPRQVKQNSDAKVSFRFPTQVASRVAIDENGAEEIAEVGRAIYRTHEKHIVQVPYISDEDITNILGGDYFVSAADEKDSTGGTDTVVFG